MSRFDEDDFAELRRVLEDARDDPDVHMVVLVTDKSLNRNKSKGQIAALATPDVEGAHVLEVMGATLHTFVERLTEMVPSRQHALVLGLGAVKAAYDAAGGVKGLLLAVHPEGADRPSLFVAGPGAAAMLEEVAVLIRDVARRLLRPDKKTKKEVN